MGDASSDNLTARLSFGACARCCPVAGRVHPTSCRSSDGLFNSTLASSCSTPGLTCTRRRLLGIMYWDDYCQRGRHGCFYAVSQGCKSTTVPRIQLLYATARVDAPSTPWQAETMCLTMCLTTTLRDDESMGLE